MSRSVNVPPDRGAVMAKIVSILLADDDEPADEGEIRRQFREAAIDFARRRRAKRPGADDGGKAA